MKENKMGTINFNDIKPFETAAKHYGVGHLNGGHSGRYPWGSGWEKFQHGADFMDRIDALKAKGWTESAENIKNTFGMSPGEYKREKTIAGYERKTLLIARANQLKDEGKNTSEIGKEMGFNESTVRGWLKDDSDKKMSEIMTTVNVIRSAFNDDRKQTMIDIGPGVETELGVSRDRLETAVHYLKTREGYQQFNGMMSQATNMNQKTIQNILAAPGVEWKEIYDYSKIGTVNEYHSDDNGKTFQKFQYPASMDPSRMMIRYAEEGGIKQDGVIEIRRGCKDLSLGDSNYAQVRILVDGTHYLKGMAVYADDLPDGVDVRFNTNKHVGKPWQEVLKPIKTDNPENPFGSNIPAKGQSYWEDEKGEKHLSLINKRSDQNDWNEWSDSLSGQFLSKQSISLIKRQLGITKQEKHEEFEKIMAIDNPVVRKYYLDKFASECDSTATHLRAAKLPGQKFHVILPLTEGCKDNECYAPNYPNGTQLALVRYPHGGIFEIPIVTVNNNIAQGKKRIGEHSSDAIGITSNVAEQLSGADFDGDTVMAIPTGKNGIKIINKKPLEGLVGFDAKEKYGEHPGMVYMTKKNIQSEMGQISNLITDMTLLGADDKELERAVRHSMVVIDAYKHKLDYKQSEADNNIKQLKAKYQVRVDENGKTQVGGASTIVSRAKGMANVAKRQGTPKINMPGKPWYDPNRPDGALIYKEADDAHYTKTKVNKRTGEVTEVDKIRTQKSSKMMETDDAYTLVSSYRTATGQMHPKEAAYADFANDLKALANQARKELVTTPNLVYSPEAKKIYSKEVASLNEKLKEASLNKTRERASQRTANAAIKEYVERAKEMGIEPSKEDIKKKATQVLNDARYDNGGKSRRDRNIVITPDEWKAIQAGAISNNKLMDILNNSDVDVLRGYATPRENKTISDVKASKIESMLNQKNVDGTNKYTTAQIAAACGVSNSTVQNIKKGE